MPFEFKQFSLHQSESAFKLGTDSVVLGSWLPVINFQRVLDIGAGTGILALMMAQKLKEPNIVAVEMDEGSAADCSKNFERSKWNNCLSVANANILDWSANNRVEKFDLVICNPPYFVDSLKNPDSRKSAARHTDSLGLKNLTELALLHLNQKGSFAFILPVFQFNQLEKLLLDRNLYPQNICSVSSYQNTLPIRKMGLFSFNKGTIVEENEFLYNEDKTRSNWYKSISADFYIK